MDNRHMFTAFPLPPVYFVFNTYILLPAESWTFGLLQSPGVERSQEAWYWFNTMPLAISQPRELSS